ncbi:MAG: hypothetical protein JRH01_05275 [Deltaproteobacteria bacterium]|nr:hypothetical protein [Deltaproteobacteria bacterium]MBW2393432.1 hypothetical protein [Deltaproteobacteria bacterium]
MIRALPLLLMAALLTFPACRDGFGSLLERGGKTPIREISADEAAALVETGAVTIVHPLPRDARAPALPNAVWLEPDDPIPDAWLDPPHPIVVIGQPEAAMALAARLARAGAGSLAVVTGELDSLSERRTARHR